MPTTLTNTLLPQAITYCKKFKTLGKPLTLTSCLEISSKRRETLTTTIAPWKASEVRPP